MDKPNLLCIDDEKRILRSLKALFKTTHNVYTTNSPAEFARLLEKHHMHVVISDQRMPEQSGTELLRFAKEMSPNSMRVLLTGYADVNDVVGSINDGEVYRYIPKPWDNDELKQTVSQATEIALKIQYQKPRTGMLVSTDSEATDGNTPPVLFADEDSVSMRMFKKRYGDAYNIVYVDNIGDFDDITSRQQFSVVIIDMDFNGESVSLLIARLKKKQPLLMTIVLTRFSDSSALIGLINHRQVYRCCPKPVTSSMIETTLEEALEQFEKIKKSPELQLRYLLEAVNLK